MIHIIWWLAVSKINLIYILLYLEDCSFKSLRLFIILFDTFAHYRASCKSDNTYMFEIPLHLEIKGSNRWTKVELRECLTTIYSEDGITVICKRKMCRSPFNNFLFTFLSMTDCYLTSILILLELVQDFDPTQVILRF